MRLLAISDLHVGNADNRAALAALGSYPDDWLALAGDVGESEQHLRFTFEQARRRFAKVLWVPGNHELWTLPRGEGLDGMRGAAKYEALVELAREYGVLTPEDDYPLWPGAVDAGEESGAPCYVAPVFALYDYSFRPEEVARADALAWAAEAGVVCSDELLLQPQPFPTRDAWSSALVARTEAKLDALPEGSRTVLVSHFPLRRDHAYLPFVPRFSIWCGTRRTELWHRRYRAVAVVSGHLHVRATRWLDGVRFDEVSFGYPSNRAGEAPMDGFLRTVLPRGPVQADGVTFHRGGTGA